jgi:hypothetical protein
MPLRSSKAAETTSGVRDTATKSFESEDLERTFSEIEIFLATFPEESRIEKASIKLVAVTFKAIEYAIGFFLKSDCEPYIPFMSLKCNVFTETACTLQLRKRLLFLERGRIIKNLSLRVLMRFALAASSCFVRLKIWATPSQGRT